MAVRNQWDVESGLRLSIKRHQGTTDNMRAMDVVNFVLFRNAIDHEPGGGGGSAPPGFRAPLAAILIALIALAGATWRGEVMIGTNGEIAGTAPLNYAVVIATQDVFVEVVPTTALTADLGACFDQSANGRLRWICNDTVDLHCAASISYSSAVPSDLLRLRGAKNGTTVAASEVHDSISSGMDTTAAHPTIPNVVQNDYISIFIANGTGTGDFEVDTLNLVCMAMM